MMEKDKGELLCICNECGEEFAGGLQDSFRSFVEELKAEGWKMRPEDGEWVHRCPECGDWED